MDKKLVHIHYKYESSINYSNCWKWKGHHDCITDWTVLMIMGNAHIDLLTHSIKLMSTLCSVMGIINIGSKAICATFIVVIHESLYNPHSACL